MLTLRRCEKSSPTPMVSPRCSTGGLDLAANMHFVIGTAGDVHVARGICEFQANGTADVEAAVKGAVCRCSGIATPESSQGKNSGEEQQAVPQSAIASHSFSRKTLTNDQDVPLIATQKQ